MGKKELINLICSAVLILSIGLVTGFALGSFHSAQAAFPAIMEVPDINPGIATVRFLKYENGLIKGEVIGQKTRLAHSPKGIVDLEPGATFEIPIYEITLYQYYSARDLPEGTRYIASKSGKYYYSILDSKAFGITPKNRLHFKTPEDAKRAGFLPSK